MISQVEQTIYRLNNLDKTQQKLNYQLSTKQQLENGSDDSVLFGRITSAQDKVRTFEGIKTIVERTKVQNDMSDSSLKEAKNLLKFIKSELMKANTDTTSDDDLKSIAVVLAGTRENLLTLANTQVEGEYLFSGSDSSKKPFSIKRSLAFSRVLWNLSGCSSMNFFPISSSPEDGFLRTFRRVISTCSGHKDRLPRNSITAHELGESLTAANILFFKTTSFGNNTKEKFSSRIFEFYS